MACSKREADAQKELSDSVVVGAHIFEDDFRTGILGNSVNHVVRREKKGAE